MSATIVQQPAMIARIGPNSLIQTVAAMEALYGAQATAQFLFMHGRPDLLSNPPGHMVSEAEFLALIAALRASFGVEATRAILADSGRRTGAYVQANRIPAPVRGLLRHLPHPLALRLLLRAISAHSWTFAGSARFGYHIGTPTHLSLHNCPECRGLSGDTPLCDYYAGAFAVLLQSLVDPNMRVVEVACAAQGAPACVFALQ